MIEIIVAGVSLLLALLSAGIAMYYFARSEKKIGCFYFTCVIFWFPWLWLWEFIIPKWFYNLDIAWMICLSYALWSIIPGCIFLFPFIYKRRVLCPYMKRGLLYVASSVFYSAVFAFSLIYVAGTHSV